MKSLFSVVTCERPYETNATEFYAKTDILIRRTSVQRQYSGLLKKKADYGDLQRVIEQALRTLPTDQREVVYMKVYEAMTFQQISEALAVSINTVASRYRYAIDKLQHQLRPYYQMENREND